MRDLNVNQYYRIGDLSLQDTRYGISVIANLIILGENGEEMEEFRVFLPARMRAMFPDEVAIGTFLSKVKGLKILNFTAGNTPNIKFLREEPAIVRREEANDSDFEDDEAVLRR